MSKFVSKWKVQRVKPTPVPMNGEYPEINLSTSGREWQKKAFKFHRNKRLRLLNAPMGSGKSIYSCLVALDELRKNPTMRAVITVPQQIIADGFSDFYLDINGKKMEPWFVKNMFFGNNTDDSNIRGLHDFLLNTRNLGPLSKITDRVAICTHQTLTRMTNQYKGQFKKLFTDVSLFVDEAHHVSQYEMTEGDVEGVNGLGTVVDKLYEIESSHITLVTATPFRGDGTLLVAGEALEKFEEGRYDLPYDEYLKNLNYLQSFKIELVLYEGNNWMKPVRELCEKTKRTDHTLWYLPHPSSNDAIQGSTKVLDTKILHGVISRVHKKKKQRSKIVDLVTPELQKSGKQYLLNAYKEDITDIVAIGMFKEGADWPQANRSVIIGRRGSLTDMVQTIGRVLRDYKEKKDASIYWLLQKPENVEEETFKEDFNDYLKAVSLCMLFQRVLQPKFKTVVRGGPKNASALTSQLSVEKMNTLMAKLVVRCIQDAEDGSCIMGQDEFRQTVKDICEEQDIIVSDFDTFADTVRVMMYEEAVEQNPKFRKMTQGMDVKQLSMNMIYQTDILAGFTKMVSVDFGVNLFNKIRGLLLHSADENKKMLLEMAERGEQRPALTTKLGSAWYTYTNKNSGCYDLEFDKTFRNLYPEWYTTQYDTVALNKQMIIQMIINGEQKPTVFNEHPLGQALDTYTRKGRRAYDAEFDKFLRDYPGSNWYVSTTSKKMDALLTIARTTKIKPKAGTAQAYDLYRFTKPNRRTYRAEFHKIMLKLVPEWFETQVVVANKKREILLQMLRDGKPRPPQSTSLGNSLNGFMKRDDAFAKEAHSIPSNWFSDNIKAGKLKKKTELLKIANEGKDRPSKFTTLGRCLSNYTCKTAAGYDSVFDKKIRKLAPHWFKKKKKK